VSLGVLHVGFADRAAFEQVGQHDDEANALLPDHSPVIVDGAVQRALTRDVFARRVHSLGHGDVVCSRSSNSPERETYADETGVDVSDVGLVHRRQRHARMFI
jgi:hypothetical protein